MIQGLASVANKQALVLLQQYLKSRGDYKPSGCLSTLFKRTGIMLGIPAREMKLPRAIKGLMILDWMKCPVFDKVSFFQIKARKQEYLDHVNKLSRERNIRQAHQNDVGVVHGTKVFFSEDWYLSDAWKKLRYQAIVKYGNRCKCCGRGPKDGVSIHVDHIRPKSLWPQLALNIDNLQILCSDCNLGKGNKDRINWGTI